jgi:hypothetical protein
MKQRSLSYRELIAALTARSHLLQEGELELQEEELEQLRAENLLDAATRARLAHLGRFFGRLGELVPVGTKVGDVLTLEEARAIWRETAAPDASDADIGDPPALH